MEFEEVKYGMLMMVLCDRERRVYDVWISFGSVHEVRAFRERKRRSLWSLCHTARASFLAKKGKA